MPASQGPLDTSCRVMLQLAERTGLRLTLRTHANILILAHILRRYERRASRRIAVRAILRPPLFGLALEVADHVVREEFSGGRKGDLAFLVDGTATRWIILAIT